MSSISSLNNLLSSSSSASGGSSLNLSSLLSAATGAATTGIDVNAAVEAAVYAAQAPERQWQTQQSTLQSQITALGTLQSSLSTLSDDLSALGDGTGAFASRLVTSSNNGLVTATASAGTAIGTHAVSVSQTASASSWYSPVLASGGELGSSTLMITQGGGKQTSFVLSAHGGQTLATLADQINAAGLGILASVVQDASGSRLALAGQSTGTAASFQATIGPSTGEVWTSADLSSNSVALNQSTLQLSDGSQSATINVVAGSSLSDVAAQINSAGLSVNASVISNNTGSHLQVTSSTGTVTASEDPALGFTQASQAANAVFSVDGVPLTSASNTVTGALPGVTLNLLGASAPVVLNVAPDEAAAATAVGKFVSDYNSVLASVSSQFAYSATTGSQGVLGSDATIRNLQGMLLGITGLTSPRAANSRGAGSLSLASLGITVKNDGTLSLDATQLNQAIASGSSDAQTFFQGAASDGFVAKVQQQLKSFTGPASGSLAADVKGLTKQYNDLQSQVNDFESGYIASQKTLLTSMYSKAEIALQSLPTTLKQLQAELNNDSGN